MASEELKSLSLKLLVETEKNQVVFAELNKDFMDVLFSFMTIPVGTVIKCAGEDSLKGEIGCLSNLYASVESLDEVFLQSSKCREMLLHPRSAAEIYCNNLKVNLNESDCNEYYACNSANCDLVSYYKTGNCPCGKDLHFVLKLTSPIPVPKGGAGFMRPSARAMISDDFHVRPMSTMTGLTLLSKVEAVDGSTLEVRTVQVGMDEVVKLIMCSLVSKTPLSEVFLEQPPASKTSGEVFSGSPKSIDQSPSKTNSKEKAKICLKLIVNTVNNRVLFAEVEEDFVDLLCSFLTFPLGYLFETFPNLSFNGCMDNLYKSIQDTEVKQFESKEKKETLLNSKLAPGLACNNQLASIQEAINLSYRTLTSTFKAVRSVLSSANGEAKTCGQFIKGPNKFMVMDSLTFMPLSPILELSLIKGAKIPLSQIGEKEVIMGEDEALRLFAASFISKCALTHTFLLKEPKQEQRDNLNTDN